MRTLSLFLILAVLLTGCGGAPSATPQATPPVATETYEATAAPRLPTLVASATYAPTPVPTATIRVKAADLRGTHIAFWYPAGSELAKQTNDELVEFNRSNVWGISAEGHAFPTGAQLEEQLQASQKTGGLPQAVAAPSEMVTSWSGANGLVAPLDGFVGDAEWGLSAQESADFWPVFWQSGLSGGTRWSIPLNGDVQVLFYNQSWAEQLGFKAAPTSPADFRTQACAAMKANVADGQQDNDGTGGWIVSNDPLALENWRQAFGGERLPDQEGQAYTFNTPASVEAFSFLRKLLNDNCAWNARNPTPYIYFAQRQALFYSGSLLDLAYQQRAMTFQKSDDYWTVLAYPSTGKTPLALTNTTSLAVLRSDKPAEQLAGWLLLRYLMMPQVEARLAEAGGTLPARGTALDAMSDYRAAHPQWAMAVSMKDLLKPAPGLASWRTVRRVLQDAAWQIFSPITGVSGIPAVLEELDTTTADLLKK